MNKPTTLSIVIPVLNEAEGLALALAALQTMRRLGVEIIVVDGGSRDDTARLAAPLADKILHAARGRALQMNTGAAAAAGEILLFLHADTRLPANAGELIINGLAQSEHDWGRFDVTITGDSPLLGMVAALMNWRSRLTGIATGDQAMFVKRSAFTKAGGFPPQPLMEDIELSARLKRRSAPLCLKNKVTTSGRRWEQHGVWRTIFLMWRLRLLYWLGTPPEKLARAYR